MSGVDVTASIMRACAEAGAWVISDEAYEHFVHPDPGAAQTSPFASAGSVGCEAALADGVLHLHTFSKSYGIAGWRA